MPPTKEFDQVNQIFGWGDPGNGARPGIWFFGIEEAGCWPEETSQFQETQLTETVVEHLIKKAVEEINLKRHELQNARFEPVKQLSDKDSKNRVYQYSSKIACTISPPNILSRWEDDWRQYRANSLYRAGSSICNANLFPLGKANTCYWPPHYTKLFGFTKAEYKDYVEKAGCGGRFQAMHALWIKSQPLATICYWGNSGRQYAELLGWEESEWTPINSEKDILCSKQLRVIITPHFSRRMSNKKVAVILEQIRNWKSLS